MAGMSGGEIAGAIGQGLQTFGKLEAGRRGGGNIGLDPARATEKDQEKIEKNVSEVQRALRPRLGTSEGQKALEAGELGKVAGSLRKGGRIKKTGVYRLHKGEEVIPADKVKRLEKRKATRKSGRR